MRWLKPVTKPGLPAPRPCLLFEKSEWSADVDNVLSLQNRSPPFAGASMSARSAGGSASASFGPRAQRLRSTRSSVVHCHTFPVCWVKQVPSLWLLLRTTAPVSLFVASLFCVFILLTQYPVFAFCARSLRERLTKICFPS